MLSFKDEGMEEQDLRVNTNEDDSDNDSISSSFKDLAKSLEPK